jgi:hypothetical protein
MFIDAVTSSRAAALVALALALAAPDTRAAATLGFEQALGLAQARSRQLEAQMRPPSPPGKWPPPPAS